MDDDGWGSPWAADESSPSTFPPASSSFTSPPLDDEDGFDDFGDVQTPVADPTAGGNDDDFADFGDFDEGPQEGFAGDAAFEDQAQLAGPSHWDALVLDPLPPRAKLQEQIDEILAPIWAYDDVGSALSDEPMREVGGLAQVLVTQESRSLYQTLLSSGAPPGGPVNWTRSRVRRQHLIALGIPVNLDEVLPHAGGKPLPALQITTRPMSAPPGARPGHHPNGSASAGGSRRGSPAPRGPAERLGLGPKPGIDEPKIEHLLSLGYDRLSLLPLPILEKHLADMRSQTASTSALLTYTLQTRDALQQDSEMYNKLIGELIGEAQKQKTGKSLSRGPSRRGTMQ